MLFANVPPWKKILAGCLIAVGNRKDQIGLVATLKTAFIKVRASEVPIEQNDSVANDSSSRGESYSALMDLIGCLLTNCLYEIPTPMFSLHNPVGALYRAFRQCHLKHLKLMATHAGK